MHVDIRGVCSNDEHGSRLASSSVAVTENGEFGRPDCRWSAASRTSAYGARGKDGGRRSARCRRRLTSSGGATDSSAGCVPRVRSPLAAAVRVGACSAAARGPSGGDVDASPQSSWGQALRAKRRPAQRDRHPPVPGLLHHPGKSVYGKSWPNPAGVQRENARYNTDRVPVVYGSPLEVFGFGSSPAPAAISLPRRVLISSRVGHFTM